MTREQGFRFGRADHLIGLAGLPAAPSTLGVIVLNAGMVHRVGPFRLHVDMTRRLNAGGYPTLRMDLSTLGDSGASGQALSRADQVRADVADAMDLLATHAGCTRFVLIGLCAGAANAHLVACSDPRVAGAVFIDGFAYRTLGYRLRRYLPRLLDPRRVLRYARALPKKLQRRAEPIVFEVTVPPREQVRRDYAGMLARGLQLCFVYSGGISEHLNHVRQFREMYGRVAKHPGTCVNYLAHTDHTYALTGDRRELLDMIAGWMARCFPAADAPAARAG